MHDFCRGAQGSDFFFFFFFSHEPYPEGSPAGRFYEVLHLYIPLIDPWPAASSTCGDEKAAHGQRHGRGERAHAEYREWKPRALLSQGETEQEPGTRAHIYRRRITPRGKSFGRSQFLSPSSASSSSSPLIQLHPSLQISPRFRALHRISGRKNKDLSFMGGGIKMKPPFEDFLRRFKYEQTSFIHDQLLDERYKILELINICIFPLLSRKKTFFLPNRIFK